MHGYRLILASLRYYWRTHLGVAVGVALATATLTGALLMGDSVDASLRKLALQRLGRVDLAIDTRQQYVDASLADRLAGELGVRGAAVLRLAGAMRQAVGPDARRVGDITVLGVTPAFWEMADGPIRGLTPTEIALSVKLARALGAQPGDEVALRVAAPTLLPQDAPLASKTGPASRQGVFTVAAVVPDSQLGRFSLRAEQLAPHNAFVDLQWLQSRTDLPGKANVVLLESSPGKSINMAAADQALQRVYRLADAGLGLHLREHGVVQLESERIFLPELIGVAALRLKLPEGGEPVGALTYLVNRIHNPAKPDAATPYSFVSALSPSQGDSLGLAPADLPDDGLLASQWLADACNLGPGDDVEIAYFRLSPTNTFVEHTRRFTVHAILDMETLQAERRLIPPFPGLSEVESCADWEIGMPMDEEALADPANEAYWERYRETPKAIISLAAGQEMWGSRFGNLTAVRYSAVYSPAIIEETLRRELSPDMLGISLQPVRQIALEATRQAMDFGGLFLGMSFFLIVAALMLTALLFVFGVQHRADQLGLLAATGWRPRRVVQALLAEAVPVVLIGAAAGVLLAVGYCRALLWGLARLWPAAVANTSIAYAGDWQSLGLGAALSAVAALAAITIAVLRQSRRPARELLAGELSWQGVHPNTPGSNRKWLPRIAAGLAIASLTIVAVATQRNQGDDVMAFFGAGTLLLLAGGTALLYRLGQPATEPKRSLTLCSLGARNASRRRGRSMAAIALLACGCFMVVAVSSMKHDPGAHPESPDSGTGGFALWVTAPIPIQADLNDEDARATFRFDRVPVLQNTTFVNLKLRAGDDASCLNLNRAQTPQLVGIDPAALSARRAFLRTGGPDVWTLLQTPLPDGVVPGLVGDANTAAWGLKRKVGIEDGDELTYTDESGEPIRVRLVGTLPMRLSVFQGMVLIPAGIFARHFPAEAGYNRLLVNAPPDRIPAVRQALAERLERHGVVVTSTAERLREFYAVESTYLNMFLILGGLGVLLGSGGLGVVVLRNVLERRPELAALRTMGYTKGQIRRLILAEHWLLLVAGIALGSVAAGLAIWPSLRAPGVEIPVGLILLLLGGVLIVGTMSVLVATRLALTGSLIDALRAE